MTAKAPKMDIVGRAIYKPSTVAKLAGMPLSKVQRWVEGYKYKDRQKEERKSAPLFRSDIKVVDGEKALSFYDLIDVLWVKGFSEHGVSMPAIRKAAEEAMRIFETSHPFCHQRFATDGKRIFLSFKEELDGDARLLDLISKQYAMDDILGPYLKYIDYETNVAARWWPLGKERAIIIDPSRSFGSPIVRQGVPTSILFNAYKAENQDAQRVADWYEVPVASVNDAVEFETHLAA